MLKLTSQAFQEGQTIPEDYTGEGKDISPPMAWSGAPAGTREFVLICDDPDAPQPEPWVHWVIYHLSPSVTHLPEGLPTQPKLDLPVRAVQGKNSFGKFGYNGPLPPVGHGTHHYHFKLYALDKELSVPAGADKTQVLSSMKEHILGQTELVGTYERTSERASNRTGEHTGKKKGAA